MSTLFAISLATLLQTTPAQVRLEGIALDRVTGLPLSFVELYTLMQPAIRVASGADGKFALEVSEGVSQTIFAAMPGYEDGSITHSAENVRQRSAVVFRLTPLPKPGVVTGRAVDATGSPLAGSAVQLFGYQRFSPTMLGAYSDHAEFSQIASGNTDDRGQYRIHGIAPGRYFLRVQPKGGPADEFSPLGAAFYPGVSGVSKAQEFEIRPGEEVGLGDLVLTRTNLQPVRVHTTNAVGNPMQKNALPSVSLWGGPVADTPPFTVGTVEGVPAILPDEPGTYLLCTSLRFLLETPRRIGYSENACTELVYTGVAQELKLTIRKPLAYLTGRVLFNPSDGSPPVPMAGVTVSGTGAGARGGTATSGTDGSFRSLIPVHDGRIKLRFLSAPEGFYITSVSQGTRDAMTDDVLVAGEDTNLEVRVARGTGNLRGRVLGADGKAVDYATVVLLPQGPIAKRPDIELTHLSVATDHSGTFEVRNIIPGAYRAFAFARIEAGSHLESRVFDPYVEQSTLIEIQGNTSSSSELRLIEPRK